MNRPSSREIMRERGYVPRYASGTCCPGCGRTNWLIGRLLAECAFCGTAVPLMGAAPTCEPVQ